MPVARLKYAGDLKKWEFAIFKWSREAYDPDELFFPGSRHVNGTIEGAMIAGLEAYPVQHRTLLQKRLSLPSFLSRFLKF